MAFMGVWKDKQGDPRTVTVVLIPGHGRSVHQARMPFWALYGLALVFVASLAGAWWVLGQKLRFQASLVQLARLRQDNLKVAEELSRGRAALAKVEKLDGQLRAMLRFKSKKKLLEQGVGGPSSGDEASLSALLESQAEAASLPEISSSMDSLSDEASRREHSFEEIQRYVDQQRSLAARTPNTWPVRGWISSSFGSRLSPFSGSETFHAGIDIAKDAGAPIKATADGKVVYAGWGGGYGKLVVVDHANGISTLYGHNSELKVSVGQRVRRGEVLALMGSTGESTGPHCHYEVHLRGVPVNPMNYLKSN
jgi:murein DD-endopeptidase MepM/ murein hydrolase activator NlpD